MSRLLTRVPGCPDPTAEQALLDTAIEFCEETQVLRLVSGPTPMTAGQRTYDLDVPAGHEVSRVLQVWCGARRLALAPAAMVSNALMYTEDVGDEQAPTGTPTAAHVTEPFTITLYPTPDAHAAADRRLTAIVALKPSRTATSLADELFNDWAEGLVHGALYRLTSMPGTTYANGGVAADSFSRYRLAINRARIEANRGRVGSPISVRATPFA